MVALFVLPQMVGFRQCADGPDFVLLAPGDKRAYRPAGCPVNGVIYRPGIISGLDYVLSSSSHLEHHVGPVREVEVGGAAGIQERMASHRSILGAEADLDVAAEDKAGDLGG